MRIGSLHSAFVERGGAERTVLDQAHYLARRNEVSVFATYARPSACYPELMRGLDIRELVGVPVRKFDLVINASLGLWFGKFFKSNFKNFDILISHQQPANWIAFRSQRPYVLLMHSLLSILYPDFVGPVNTWDSDFDRIAINYFVRLGGLYGMRWIDTKSVKGASAVIVQGKKLGQLVRDIFGVRPVQVPYGMDFSYYRRSNPRALLHMHLITPPLVLMVTRSIPSKRPDVMIRIMPEILKNHPTATLVIVCGPSTYTWRWASMARSLGISSRTRIISASPYEMNALYSGASVLGYPTQAFESVGRVVLEALAFGVPPVVWNNGWGPAEIVHDGIGFRAQPYDLRDFADKTLALLNDDELRRRMGKEGERYVRKTFSWKNAGPPLERVLKQCASSP